MHTPECSDRSYVVAVCLSGVFGILGVQHFYLGRWLPGIIDVSLTLGALVAFGQGDLAVAIVLFALDFIHTFVVTIMLLTGSFRDGQGKIVCYPGQRFRSANRDT